MKTQNIIVKNSEIEGQGVFANRDFKKGEVVLKWDTSFTLTEEDLKDIADDEKRYIANFGNRSFLQQAPARFVNHSCDPNTKVVDGCSDVAIRDIKKGEEITSCYLDPDEIKKCTCQNKNCKGVIKNEGTVY